MNNKLDPIDPEKLRRREVTPDEFRTIAAQSGWQQWTVELLLKPKPVHQPIACGQPGQQELLTIREGAK